MNTSNEVKENLSVDSNDNTENNFDSDEYNDDNYDEDLSFQNNEYFDLSNNMNQIETEVFNVFCYLKNYEENSDNGLLEYLELNDVYKLIYPHYEPPF